MKPHNFLDRLARIIHLVVRTETKKTGVFSKQKSERILESIHELFCEEKMAGFFVEFHNPSELFGLIKIEIHKSVESGRITGNFDIFLILKFYAEFSSYSLRGV